VVVPGKISGKLIDTVHRQFGHIGTYKTSKYIQGIYYWKGMSRDIRRRIRGCDICQRVKHNNINMEGKYKAIIPDQPNEIISVDFYGPLPQSIGGVQYLIVILDVFSKHIALYAIKKANTRTVLKKLKEDYFMRIGKPRAILSDNGTQFTSRLWKETLEAMSIRVLFSSVRHPKSNPVERVMRELGRFFRTYCSDQHTRWAKHVKTIEDILNVTTHSSTTYTPYEAHYGIGPQFKIKEIIKFPREENEVNIQSTHIKQKLEFSAQARGKQQKSYSKVSLHENDLVLLRTPHLSKAIDKEISKFFELYEGPYRINKMLSDRVCQLSDIKNKDRIIGIYNQALLKKYIVGNN